ncbi:MAG: hypothetical protein ACK5S7_04515 [Dolichospermum sp.]
MTREQGTGNREQVTGNRLQGTGNFTFCYLCQFFFRSLTYSKPNIQEKTGRDIG